MVGLYPGMNALLVSLDTVERKLGENDWIEKVSVKRIFPDGFAIRIKEKEPRFWLRRDGILYYADAVGHLITEVSPGRFASLPTLEIEPGAEDMANRLPELMASLAKVRFAIGAAGISRVRISPARSVEIFLAKTRVALFIGEESWSENLLRLAVVLEDMARRGEIKDVEEVRVHGSGVWVRKRIPAA
ncbi:hypothetical protein FACS1894206_00590 [Deltaproteobacteria bacterium]|nr:hypothetical protein FACS1894206_00590 [Deltaproteobacteria bacterium]